MKQAPFRLLSGLLVAGVMALAAAGLRADPTVEPVVAIHVPQTQIHLGMLVPSIPEHNAEEVMELLVYANIPHGGVIATLSPLEHEDSAAQIAPERVLIRRVGTTQFIPLSGQVNLTGNVPPGMFQYAYQFKVESSWADAPGEYGGILTLTYGVAP